MEKSSGAVFRGSDAATARRRLSRRHWFGAMFGAGAGALAAEVASLGGAWDHARASPVAAVPSWAKASASRQQVPAPRLTHIGHSCHLIEIAGQRWLTDPWFFDPAFGSLRHQVAHDAGSLGRLDGIFISHRHADHFDPAALRLLDKRAQVWVADESLLGPLVQMGFGSVQQSTPWHALTLGGLTLAFAPAVHDVPQHSLILLAADARVLFCADTGYHPHFGEIRRRYRPATALLPCDGTALRWEPRQIMNPEEAARAAIELGCREVLPTHLDAVYSDAVARHLLSTSVAGPFAAFGGALEAASRAAARDGPAGAPSLHALGIGECRALGA
jgi:L-ascorbate metabolism protein UlaG (beta-lactamase superfamily)